MSADGPKLVDLAKAISDGVAVDWPTAIREAADTVETERIQELMRIERVVAAHRALHAAPAEASPSHAGDPASVPGSSSPSHRTWGPLVLVETIGRGAYGDVFIARDPHLDREVALKLLRVDAPGGGSTADAVIDEGRLMARVRHPNVVTVYGAERHDGRVGLWMELIHGQQLSQIREEQGVFGAREAGLIGLDVCRALAAVHQAGLVHHDVKAENVMRERGGRIVLMDFSAGRDVERTGSSHGVVSGTPLYMPPEAFDGRSPDHRGDIYSLGVLLFHLVTGSFPVVAQSIDELREAHHHRATQLLAGLRPDLPPAFVRVVERALAPDPHDRFGSVAAMEQALAVALGIEGRDEKRDETATTVARRQLRFRIPALVAIAALAIVAASWLSFRGERPATETAPAPTAGRSPESQLATVPAGEAELNAEAHAPPPPVTMPPVDSYKVEASFYRGTVARQRLVPDGRVRVGDALSLEFTASRRLYVYVVNEDDNGEAVLLFPLAGHDSENPLAANAVHLLPGARDGKQDYWQVTSAGGREHFLVIASPNRLVEFEAETVRLTRPRADRPLQYASLTPEAKEHLRGVAGLVTAPRPEQGGTRNRHFYSAVVLSSQSENVHGAWVRRLDLENPVR